MSRVEKSKTKHCFCCSLNMDLAGISPSWHQPDLCPSVSLSCLAWHRLHSTLEWGSSPDREPDQMHRQSAVSFLAPSVSGESGLRYSRWVLKIVWPETYLWVQDLHAGHLGLVPSIYLVPHTTMGTTSKHRTRSSLWALLAMVPQITHQFLLHILTYNYVLKLFQQLCACVPLGERGCFINPLKMRIEHVKHHKENFCWHRYFLETWSGERHRVYFIMAGTLRPPA